MERLKQIFQKTYGAEPEKIISLKGDGSDRKIYRIFYDSRTVIGIVGDDFDENVAFVEFTNYFRAQGLRVPEIYAADLRNGVYLEEDLGDATLFDWMCAIRNERGFTDEIKKMYRQVIEYLPNFQIKAGAGIDYTKCYQHVIFGKHSMNWDLHYFKNRFVEIFYKGQIDHDAIEGDFKKFIEFLLEEERKYFLYRDFQSRNVMIRDDLSFYIDYQSGRKGVLQYDVASLLWDAKANLPQDFRDEMVAAYLKKVQEFERVDEKRFMKYFYGFVLIRMMQAFGAYGYLSVVKKKKHFFKSVPFALKNLQILLDKNLEIFDKIPTLSRIFEGLVIDEELYRMGE